MLHDTSIPQPITQRAYCLQAIDAHNAAYERALADLRRAQTEDERATALWFMDNADREVARWREALRDAS